MAKNVIDIIALVLAIVGGINWGLVGLFNWNLVEAIFGGFPIIERVIYVIVGLAALWCISILTKD